MLRTDDQKHGAITEPDQKPDLKLCSNMGMELQKKHDQWLGLGSSIQMGLGVLHP